MPETFLLLIKQRNLTPISYFINKLFYMKLLVINYRHLAIKQYQKIEIKYNHIVPVIKVYDLVSDQGNGSW